LAFSAYSAQLNTTNLLSEEKILLSTAYLYIVSANVLFPTPVGQEMLFLLMDKGIYRRLGESDIVHKANVFIVCATTEDIHSSL
ncbi:hypothetical protein, partial [Clostridioides difficile]|uniref:hypothetical protein n=1 Tax=Clostridioides difficile TaxID=1496 RepID=UPI002ECFDD48